MSITNIVLAFNSVIIIYTISILTIFCVNIVTSAMVHVKKNKRDKDVGYVSRIFVKESITVSLLVPAYNEEEVIVDSILSQSKLDYNGYEIIVINDGSTDATCQKVIKAFDLQKIDYEIKQVLPTQKVNGVYRGFVNNVMVTLVDKANGGKADALNAGINASRYPFFVAIDADCIIKSDAITKLVFPIVMNKETIAVGGNVKISNNLKIVDGEIVETNSPKGLLVIYQMLEYLRVFLISRIAWSKYKSNILISGAFGLFRKDRVVEIGGYRVGTIGEDMELVIRLNLKQIEEKREYYIVNEETAYCFTQAPDKWADFKGQRVRWHVGLMQSLYLNRKAAFNPKYRRIGMLGLAYYILFELLSSVIEVLGYIAILLAFIFGIYNFKMFLFLSAFIFVFSFAVTLSAVILEGYSLQRSVSFANMAKLLFLSFLEPFFYRQCCNFIRIYAMLRYNHFKNKWGKIKRKKYAENEQ